ncbi:beta-ketoacyl synthase N-terminal-like domain-containing protein [Streptomyces sp. E11-3]|uniref:beta-ketoacyl synthase N-terminal-like domain-containing protein n=1 Tax=Streptomyces sp. E11-3 TaxID=3110112 RepID=UPI00397ED1E9
MTERTVITGLGTAVRGVAGPADLLAPLPEGHEDVPHPVTRLTGRGLRYKDRATKLAMVAARDALHAAGLVDEQGEPLLPGESTGVVVSTNYGNVDTVCETVQTIADDTYLGTSPMLLPATSSNVVASWLAITHGLRGANLTLCNGPASGIDAVDWARLLVAAGRVERVLVVGVEPDNAAVRHVAESETLFDGAAALVVESARSAAGRGAPMLAELGPYARRGDHTAAVASVRDRSAQAVGLWCVPEHPEGIEAPAPALGVSVGTAQIQDLAARFGPASGALGVLQTVAATAWLATADDGAAALLSSGTGDAGGDDAASALILAAA